MLMNSEFILQQAGYFAGAHSQGSGRRSDAGRCRRPGNWRLAARPSRRSWNGPWRSWRRKRIRRAAAAARRGRRPAQPAAPAAASAADPPVDAAGQLVPDLAQLERVPVRRIGLAAACRPSNFARADSFWPQNALGIGSVALAWLLQRGEPAGRAAHAARRPRVRPDAQAAARAAAARAMISLFMHGGPSHVDLFDPKPELTKHSGSDYPGEVVYSFVNRASKKLFGSPWKFAKHGQCGTEVSELLPHLAEHRRRHLPRSARCTPASTATSRRSGT